MTENPKKLLDQAGGIKKRSSLEYKEEASSYLVRAQGLRGEEGSLGRFVAHETGVRFLANTEHGASDRAALEGVFCGDVTEFVSPKGERTYHLAFPKENAHLCLSMIFGVRRSRRVGNAYPEVIASIGHTNEEYGTWRLSEDQWREMDTWLQSHMK